MTKTYVKIYENSKVPICAGCGKPILRNHILIDGEDWHHGCAKNKGLAVIYRCNNCYQRHPLAAVRWTYMDGEKVPLCPNCGCAALKRAYTRRNLRLAWYTET